jgi:hypothetical protein
VLSLVSRIISNSCSFGVCYGRHHDRVDVRKEREGPRPKSKRTRRADRVCMQWCLELISDDNTSVTGTDLASRQVLG